MKQFWAILCVTIIIWSCDTRDNSFDSVSIDVNSQPAGARISINGIDAGVVTPATIRWNDWTTNDNLTIGLALDEYFSWNTEVARSDNPEYIWHQMVPDYPVGELGNAELPDTVWFTDSDFNACSDPLVGTLQVHGRVNNVIGDSVVVAIFCQENDDDMWRIVPQPNGDLTVPLYGYGYWKAQVNREWWRGSVLAVVVDTKYSDLNTDLAYSWWNWAYDIPTTALNFLGTGEFLSPLDVPIGWKINWYANYDYDSPLRIEYSKLILGLDESHGTYLYSFTTVNATSCPYPYKTGKYSLTVDSRLNELPANAKFVFAIRPLGEWSEDHWVGFELVKQDSLRSSFINGLMSEDPQRRNFTIPSSWPGSITYQIELTPDAIGLAKLRVGLGDNPGVWQDSTSFIIPVMDQTNIVMQLEPNDFELPSPTTTVTLDNFTYTP